MDISEYLRVLRRRWLIIASCVFVTTLLAAFFTFRAVPQYASSAQLFVSTPGSGSAEAYQGSLFSQQRVTSYADLVTSREVASRVQSITGDRDSVTSLTQKVKATVIPETVILEITVSDADPEMAQKYAQAYAEKMKDYITELEGSVNSKTAPITVTIAENASLPDVPYSPQPIRNLGLAAFLGLFLGLLAAVLRDTFDTTIKGSDDVTALSGLPLMGNIALDPQTASRPLITDLPTHAPRAEAFRVLRTNLQFVDVDNPNKVFTITSAVPGEGKTSTAVNLAIALAQAGHRTLLIDADLRRPSLEEKFGIERAVGLTTVLVGQVKFFDAIQVHDRSGLDVLASGSAPPNPAELLQSQAMREVLANARATYDTVVIDAPPLLPVTDAALLSAQSDGALIITRHGRTTRDQLLLSIERLRAVDARAVGVVLNMVPNRRFTGAGYGYGYGYGYGPELQKGKRKAQGEA